ncbi:MAG: hypothetical protein Q8K36_02550, partial [Alphaproteobacteria bacterium]|nr:hypothetical protein [Alphaproteobacteria bacterium]
EKSLNDLSPNASALALHAKNNIEYAKGTMVRAVQGELATQAMISAINEGIELLTEAIHLTAGEVNDLNPADIKAHTNEVFQSLLAGYEDMINQVLWNDKQMLAGLAQPLQFQLGKNEEDLITLHNPDITLLGLNLTGYDILDSNNAADAQAAIRDALKTLYSDLAIISGNRQDIKNVMERTEWAVTRDTEGRSLLIDTDVPEALSNVQTNQAQNSIIYARLAQMNAQLRDDVELFRSK